jgi:hypothetical protein
LNALTISTKRHVNKRYNVSQKLKRRIQQIWQQSDFDRFLVVSFENDLKITAKCDSIVIVNVNNYRCDALIIEKNQIRALRLSHLHINNIRDCTTESLMKSEILKWLWKTIAQWVFDMLRFTQISFDDCWSYIWWIFTNSLTKFFIHATECRSESSSNNVLDRTISFYNFSVKTIIHDRSHRSQIIKTLRSEKIILIAMQKTSNQKDL